jgi:hypothetical protein
MARKRSYHMPRLFGIAALLVVAMLVLPSFGADEKDDKKKDGPAKAKADAAKNKEADDEEAPKKKGAVAKKKGADDDDEAPKKKGAVAKKKSADDDDDVPKKKGATVKKKGADDEDDAPDKAKKQPFTWGQELVGRLQIDGNSQKDFTLHVTQKIMEPDYGAQQQFAQQQMQLQQQQVRIATARNLQERQQAMQQYYNTMNQLAQTQQRLFRPKDLNFDVQLRFGENTKVRLLQPPIDYDEKGNLKRYTNKELQELRGKENLPGYTAEADALRSGQTVKVYLGRNQGNGKQGGAMLAGGKAGMPKAGKKKKTDDEDVDDVGMARPEAVMIMVLVDPMPAQ